MKRLLFTFIFLNIGFSQSSDSLISFYNYPDFQNITANLKILKKNDSQVLIAFNKLSENDTLDLIIALIDHDGNLLSYSQYQELNNLVDIAMVSDSSYVFATNDELWRLNLINDSYNIHLLTDQFNGHAVTSLTIGLENVINITTTQDSPSEVMQFDLDGNLLSYFNIFDPANDDDIYEILRHHIITSDGGFLFSNGSSIYKTNSQGQIEWINNNLEITQTLDIVEQNRNFVLVGTYSIYGYIDYDYGCGYIDCAAIAILIDEYGEEIVSQIYSTSNTTSFTSCIAIEDGYIFTGYSNWEFITSPIVARVDENFEQVSQYDAGGNGLTTDMLKINDNEFFSVGWVMENYSTIVLSIWHHYYDQLAQQSNCIADDGTDGVDLWGNCYSIENTSSIFLTGPEFEDTISPLIGNLVNLTSLEINWTEIHGNIPSEIGNLTNLTTLSLTGNFLSGEIPPELGNLTSLTTLSLSDNDLSGSIPSELGNLINLTDLKFFDTELSGEIPSEFGNLVNLTSIELHNNNLEGPIPSEIGNLINLTNLHLWNNYLVGDVPLGIWNLNNLVELDLSTNQLTGSISPNIGSMENLEEFGLSENQFNGLIPESICELELVGIGLEGNQFCPPYPYCTEDYLGEQDTSNCENVSVVDEIIPLTYKLYNAYPNPFNPATTLRYDLPIDGIVNITVYDMMGRIINNLVSSKQSSGFKSVHWNATDNFGQPVSAGVYLYQIETGNFTQTKKMLLLK